MYFSGGYNRPILPWRVQQTCTSLEGTTDLYFIRGYNRAVLPWRVQQTYTSLESTADLHFLGRYSRPILLWKLAAVLGYACRSYVLTANTSHCNRRYRVTASNIALNLGSFTLHSNDFLTDVQTFVVVFHY